MNEFFSRFKIRNPRTRNILLGSFSMVTSQGASTIIGFIITGLLARYFSPEEFGLWTLLMSLTVFFVGFDLGFGNALRNKLAQLQAQKGTDSGENARFYFFSIFYFFMFWGLVLALSVFLLKPLIPWAQLFNTADAVIIRSGSILFAIGIALSAVNISFSISASGFFGYQESQINALFIFLQKAVLLLFTLVFIFFRKEFFAVNLMFFLVILFSSVIYFFVFLQKRHWGWILLKFQVFREKISDLWKKSLQFALLQIFSNIYALIDLFIISKIMGLEMVGDYSLIKKLYLLFNGLHFVFLLPVWSAYTEAVEQKNFDWVKKVLKRSAIFTLLFFIFTIFFLSTAGDKIIYLWSGRKIINFPLYFILGFWSLISAWNSCFSIFLNSVGILKFQIFWLGLGIMILIPLANFWGNNFGIIGVCAALILTILPSALSNPIQTYFFLKRIQNKQS